MAWAVCVCCENAAAAGQRSRADRHNGRRARGAEGQRNTAPVLLFLCESELGQKPLKLAARPAARRDTKHDTNTAAPRRRRPHAAAAVARTRSRADRAWARRRTSSTSPSAATRVRLIWRNFFFERLLTVLSFVMTWYWAFRNSFLLFRLRFSSVLRFCSAIRLFPRLDQLRLLLARPLPRLAVPLLRVPGLARLRHLEGRASALGRLLPRPPETLRPRTSTAAGGGAGAGAGGGASTATGFATAA